jgi:hypothetical protein
MKARRVYSCALVLSFLVCSLAYSQLPAEVAEAAGPVVNTGLTGVDEVYVRVVADRVTEINLEQLESEIGRRLTENGLKVVPADVSAIDDEQKQKIKEMMAEQGPAAKNLRIYSVRVPELIVRVSVLQGNESGPCVYHIQTSFAREVYLRGSRTRMKAEVWRIDVPIGIADADKCEAAIKAGATGQVDTFIAEWKRASANKMRVGAEEAGSDAATSVAEGENEQTGQTVQYEYVASKNSKVFHKRDCQAAARISSENLIGFKTRDEAIQSGRRPCKICNP